MNPDKLINEHLMFCDIGASLLIQLKTFQIRRLKIKNEIVVGYNKTANEQQRCKEDSMGGVSGVHVPIQRDDHLCKTTSGFRFP